MMLATTLSEFHHGFSWVVIFTNGLAGAWALGAHRVEALRLRALWWFTVLAQLTIFVQVFVGVGLQSGQDIEPAPFHPFYGFVGIIAVGMLFSYRGQMRPHRFLLYGFGGLFVMGLAIRAFITAT
jgi:hypothetical protein